MPYAYEEGSKAFDIDIQQSKKGQVIDYLFDVFGKDRLFRTSYYNEKRNLRGIHPSGFLLIENPNVEFEKLEIDGQIVAKNQEDKNYKGDGYFVFNLLFLYTLDSIQQVDANVDYKDFFEYSVYEFMSKVQIAPQWASKEKIAERKPMSVKELAYCVHDVVKVNERNICHWVNHAIIYYKLAKLRMLGLIDDSYEYKPSEITN
jgi:predicted nucleic acid-binding OB-fold protein